MKGVPVRIVIGPRDIENGTMEIARRDTGKKQTIRTNEAVDFVENLLVDIQTNLYQKALDFQVGNTQEAKNWEEFQEKIEQGFVYAHWDGTAETEEKIKKTTKATIRCIPLDNKLEAGKCVYTGEVSKQKVLFARAY